MKQIYELKNKDLMPVILESVKVGQSVKLTITGSSMSPLLRHLTDQFTLEICDLKKLKVGDIVLVLNENEVYILHRICEISGNSFYMIGDAQLKAEGPFPKESVKAIATYFERGKLRFSTRNFVYKVYSWIWIKFIKQRKLFLNIYRILAKIKSYFK